MGAAMAMAAQHIDVEYLRELIRKCLRAKAPRRSTALGNMVTKPRPEHGEQKLARPASAYEVDTEDGPIQKVKPGWGQWATTTHATGTRPPGFSRENITPDALTQARYVREIWPLPTKHIQALMAGYSPSAELRRNSRRGIVAQVVSNYRNRDTKERARVVTKAVLMGHHTPAQMRALLDLSVDDWNRSRLRKMRAEIIEILTAIDVDALLAWEARIDALDNSAPIVDIARH